MRVTVSGIDTTIRRLKAYQSKLQSKKREFMERLANIGIDTAGAIFRTAQYDGTNDVVMQPFQWVDEKTLVISATGHAVTFIEFGTGVHYAEEHPKAAEMGAIRGGYGQGKGKQDTWGYYGEPGTNGRVKKTNAKGTLVLTHGNPPARTMYEAGKEMRRQIRTIAQEVFRG